MKKYKGGVVKNVYQLSEQDEQKILDEYNLEIAKAAKIMFPVLTEFKQKKSDKTSHMSNE